MNSIGIYNETKEIINDLETIEELIDFALKHENLNNVEFNVIIIDNNKIQEINKKYRDIDKPTDVISFALEDDENFPKSDYRILGDIYISIDKAKEQSISYNHSLKRELSFLTIHGLLHLLGYDHMNTDEEKRMFEKQELILNEYGITR